MTPHDRFIELDGYQRLEEVERRIWYAPPAIGLAGVGLVGAGLITWSLWRGVVNAPAYLASGYAVFLGAYGALFAYYHWHRFHRVECPQCEQVMQPYLTDLDDNYGLGLLGGVNIDGRRYRPPYDEDDRRPWVRLMAMVRACRRCQTYVNCSRLHYETCTDEELGQIQQRMGGAL